MKQAVAAISPLLKAVGFRKRRNSFNRVTAAGLTHVVDLQRWPFEFSSSGEELLTFSVNLGVHVPSLHSRLGLPQPRSWINEYDCALRHRLAQLARGEDGSWQLDDVDDAVADVQSLLTSVGLPWLERFQSRSDIIDVFFAEDRRVLGMNRACALHVGLLLLDEGEVARAEQVISAYLRSELSRSHRTFLETEFLPAQGLAHLADTTS